MFCTNCGKQNEDDSRFCVWCMREVLQRSIFPYKYRKLALIFLLLIASGIVGKTALDVSRAMSLSVPTQNVPQRQEMTVVKDQFTVAKGTHWSHRFDIMKGWHDVRIVGKFTAAGTTSDGLQMFLVTEEGFERFISGGAHPTLGSSGQTTSNTFSQLLDPGTYYLVFDNNASAATDKAVNASFKLEYSAK